MSWVIRDPVKEKAQQHNIRPSTHVGRLITDDDDDDDDDVDDRDGSIVKI